MRNTYRIILKNIATKEISDGYLQFTLHFLVIDKISLDCEEIKETFTNSIKDSLCVDFFFFLEKAGVKFDDYFELVGLVAEAEMVKISKTKPVLILRELLLPPVGM